MNIKNEVLRKKSTKRDVDFIKRVAGFSLEKFLKKYNVSKSSFYKGYVNDDVIHFLKNEILEYLFNEQNKNTLL